MSVTFQISKITTLADVIQFELQQNINPTRKKVMPQLYFSDLWKLSARYNVPDADNKDISSAIFKAVEELEQCGTIRRFNVGGTTKINYIELTQTGKEKLSNVIFTNQQKGRS